MRSLPVILLACFFLLGPALRARAVSVNAIESAVEDELYDLAERQIWEVLSTEPTPAQQTDLTLLLVRTLIGKEEFTQAIELCSESQTLQKQDAFFYWKALAQIEAGQPENAYQTLETFPENSPLLAAALRLQGRAAVACVKPDAAETLFQRFDKAFPTHAEAAQNLLDLVDVYLSQNHEKAVRSTLDQLLKRFPDTIEADSGRMMLARVLIADGGRKNQAKAAELLRQLGQTETAHPRMRIAAWVELSLIERDAGRPDAAAEALEEAERFTQETVLRVRQQATRANLLFDDEKPDEALALFDAAIRVSPDQETAAAILIQKAEALLEHKQFSDADEAFQSCLNVTEQPDVQRRALLGKGWCFWHQNRFEEAAVQFEKATEKSADITEWITGYMKAGDAWLQADRLDRAVDNYNRAVATDPDSPLAAQAAYQAGLVLLKTGDGDEAFRTFNAVETGYPATEFARQAALRKAEILKNKHNPAGALEQYVRVASQTTDATIRSAAIHQQGLLLFEMARYEDAFATFATLLETYPESTEAPQAFYMRGRCRYQQGRTEEALDIFRAFIDGYPDAHGTPEVFFLLAEYAYNRGDYPEAHDAFLDITQRYPQHALADDALFWAGSALLQQDQFLDAFTLYTRLAGDYPGSDLLMQTRFAQGDALTELGEFSRAILAYEEIVKTEPDTLLGARARGRLGDCLFTLGASDPERYPGALAAYQALGRKADLPYELKLQALCKTARCEEKIGNNTAALEHYTAAVYSIDEQHQTLSPAAVLWFTRSAFEAADLLERQQKWREAVHIYTRIVQANVPAADEAGKRIEKIRQDHPEKF